MPELIKNEVIDLINLIDSNPQFTIHLKDGSTDKARLFELGSYFEINADTIQLQKLTPRRRRFSD
jgi:hypothetical protein